MLIIILGVLFIVWAFKPHVTQRAKYKHLVEHIETEVGVYKCYSDKLGYYRLCSNRKLLHRFIAEVKFKRKLRYWEVIHHIDGNKKNNSLKNLWVCNKTEHRKIHEHNKAKYGNWHRPQWSKGAIYTK